MTVKWIGAILIICACGGFGFRLAAVQKREERDLRELMCILEFMSNELQCHLTPLPILCRQAAQCFSGNMGRLFTILAHELEQQLSSNAAECMESALYQCSGLPENTVPLLRQFGSTLGRFDLEGQQKELLSLYSDCSEALSKLKENRDTRHRTYQTLGLCAGAALAILFI